MFLGAGIKAGKYQEAATPADLAPTLLDLMGLPQPAEMTGKSLRQPNKR